MTCCSLPTTGIMMSMAVFGPAVGFIAGGTFLSIYVDAPFYEAPE